MQFLSGLKQTEFACPAVNFAVYKSSVVDEKQAHVDATHLDNSDKLSRITYGADKIHIIIY